eukprot:8337002-Ditylum_brightwellii.AAC.1
MATDGEGTPVLIQRSLGKVTRCTGIWGPWASSHHKEHGKKEKNKSGLELSQLDFPHLDSADQLK